MTGQSLYYLGEMNLKHKILAVVEEAGSEKASYALKLLQSEGEPTSASTGKAPNTGRMVPVGEMAVYWVEKYLKEVRPRRCSDIRYIQQLLGHENLETTAIYTEVNIRQLQEVHARCHPSGLLASAAVKE